jgi:hypothetical protein
VRVAAGEAGAGEERVRDGDAGEVMMQPAVGAAFVVIQAEALLELAVVMLDPPSQLRELHEPGQRDVFGENRQGAVKRWMHRNDRPGRLAALPNRVQTIAAATGHGVKGAVIEVRGRRTGRLLSFPGVVADYQGGRYLVAMLGESTNWIRNVSAAGGHVVLRHGRREAVRLEEVDQSVRAPILLGCWSSS